MLLVGLTGGIGSGKTTVARLLAERGAVVFDADVLAREAVEPGTPGYAKVVERFGTQILRPDGAIDRGALAAIVFADAEARSDLESIVHPQVRRLFAEACEQQQATDHVVVLSAPLLVETGMHTAFDVLVVVSTTVQTQTERLMRERGMTEEQVLARIYAQAPLEDKAAVADYLIDNEGGPEDLAGQVDRVWAELVERAETGTAPGTAPGETPGPAPR